MDITKVFVLDTPVAVAWEFLTDPRRVASCLPGAAITGQADDRTHTGTITVKVGPVSASYKGTVRFVRLDPASRTAEISASGRDTRGKGGADMTMTSRLSEQGPSETEVSVVSQVNVMGVLAQFGRGMIQDVSEQMFQRFVDALRAQLEAPAPEPQPSPAPTPAGAEAHASPDHEGDAAAYPNPDPQPRGWSDAAAFRPGAMPPRPASPPIEVFSFGSAVVGRAVVRAARNPAVWAAALGGALAFWALRRSRRRRT